MVEIWRPITRWFSGLYLVSNLGNIRRYGKVNNMKPSVNSGGLLTVTLSHEGVRHNTTVAQLVAEAFIPNPDNHPNVMYLDGDVSNVCADNLLWVADHEIRWMRKAVGQAYSEYRFPVQIMSSSGQVWASINKCAEYLDVSKWAVTAALNSGLPLKGHILKHMNPQNLLY